MNGVDPDGLSKQSAQNSGSWSEGNLQDQIDEIPLPFRNVQLNPAGTKILIQNTVTGRQIVYDPESNYYRVQATKGSDAGKYLSTNGTWVTSNKSTADESHFNNTGAPLNPDRINEMNDAAGHAFAEWWESGSYQGETAAASSELQILSAEIAEEMWGADDLSWNWSTGCDSDPFV